MSDLPFESATMAKPEQPKGKRKQTEETEPGKRRSKGIQRGMEKKYIYISKQNKGMEEEEE